MDGKRALRLGAEVRPRALLATALALGLGLAGCAAPVGTGAFRQVERVETGLVRGQSTRMDVRRVLGPPNGRGHSLLPPDLRPRDVWFYFDTRAEDIRFEGGGNARMRLRQQILIVFFEQDLFDGFMWYSTVSSPEIR